MEEQLISSANLDAIEDNLGFVAKELSGVISNVNSVNEQINGIEENISTLNNELGNLVKEIQETTNINNARQTIMYNDKQIEKKYGYYDIVRRRMESLLSAIDSSNINRLSLLNIKDDLLLNNPNYWLSNALMSLIFWLVDDKENCTKELRNSMNKNREKTSAFFCLINLKLGRINTAINWLNSYLNNEDPTNLSKDFVTILDLVSNNEFGTIGKNMIIDKINIWFERLSNNPNFEKTEINKWKKYIKSKEDKYIELPYLENIVNEVDILKNNLEITSSYKNILSELKYIIEKKYNNKSLDEILNNLIYDYEQEEQIFQEDNFKNRLIIENDGNREKALQIYENEKTIYEKNVNILSLLNNIVIYDSKYNVSDETRKLALSLIKNNILLAYEQINKGINKNSYHITIDDFNVEINDNNYNQYIENKLDEYLAKKYYFDYKTETIILSITNILAIICIILSLKIKYLAIFLLAILIIFDIFYSYQKIYLKNKTLKKIKKETKLGLLSTLERGLAESIDYKNSLKQNEQDYLELKTFLERISTKNYIRSNDERSIDING